MTIVVYRDGVMASDTGLFLGDIIVSTSFKKIIRTKDGALAGGSGPIDVLHAFHAWANGTRRKKFFYPEDDRAENFCGLLAMPNGTVQEYYANNCYSSDSDFYAIGSAQEVAIGALCAGVNAQEAVRICIERHCHATGGVVFEELSKRKPPK